MAYLRVVISVSVGIAAMFPADQFGFSTLRLGAAGLALGSSAGAWIEYVMLRRSLNRQIGSHSAAGAKVLRMTLAAACAAVAGVLVQLSLPVWHPALVAMASFVPFGLVYLGAGAVLGVRSPIRFSRP